MRERAAERLGEAGFDELDVERILELVPLATHNQRGRGTLFVGTEAPVNAEELVRIVEGSMSSPVYELLKRPDELFVVEHAHLQPRFVEDSVRIALRDTLEAYPQLGADDFLLSRQVNLETIHTHDVVAERYGTAGELRAELEGEVAERHTELRESRTTVHSLSRKWPPPSSSSKRAFGSREATYSPCGRGVRTSSSPCQTRVSTVTSSRSKPQGLAKARSSSAQPREPWRTASVNDSFMTARNSGLEASCPVDLGQLAEDLLDHVVRVGADAVDVGLEEGLDRLAALHRGAELLHVQVGEALVEVEVLGVGRRRRDERADADDPVGQQGSAGQRVRRAAGAADDGEALEAELVGDRGDVGGRVGDRAAEMRVGAPVPGPVVGHSLDAVTLVEARVRVPREAAAGSAVREDHREAVLGAARDVGQRAAVGGGQRAFAHGRDHRFARRTWAAVTSAGLVQPSSFRPSSSSRRSSSSTSATPCSPPAARP